MEPVDEKCGNSYFSNHYQLWLAFCYHALPFFYLFIVIFFLQVVKACCFLRNCSYFVEAKGYKWTAWKSCNAEPPNNATRFSFSQCHGCVGTLVQQLSPGRVETRSPFRIVTCREHPGPYPRDTLSFSFINVSNSLRLCCDSFFWFNLKLVCLLSFHPQGLIF